jgi:hypothetical protein
MMRVGGLAGILAILAVVLVGCNQQRNEQTVDGDIDAWMQGELGKIVLEDGKGPILRDKQGGLIRWLDQTHLTTAPRPHAKPTRARIFDKRRYPRRDFNFVVETGYGFRIDTFSGTVTKDLMGGDSTIALTLSPAEMDTIYQRTLAIQLFRYPEPHPLIEFNGMSQPHTTYHFYVKAGDHECELNWDSRYDYHGETRDEWERLWGLIWLIYDVVNERPEYKALPPSPVYI